MELEEQTLEQQVTSLGRRFEMFKVTMTMEVKDLEHQLEGMRQSSRQRIADSAAELESQLKDRVLRQMREDVAAEVSGQILSARSDMAEQLQQLSCSVKDDIGEVEQKLVQMRKALMEDFVDLGQRPVFDFMQSVQASLREEMADLRGELDDLRTRATARGGADSSRRAALPSSDEVGSAGSVFETIRKVCAMAEAPVASPHPGDFGGVLETLHRALQQQQRLQEKQQGCACRPPELTGAETQQAAICQAPPGGIWDALTPPHACPSVEPLLRCLGASHASLQREIAGLDERLRAALAGRASVGGAGWRPQDAAAGASRGSAEASAAAPREDEAATPLGAPAVAVAADWLGEAPGRDCARAGGLLRSNGLHVRSLTVGTSAAASGETAGAEGLCLSSRSCGSAADAKSSPAPPGLRKAP